MDVRESLQSYFTDCTYRNLSCHTLRVYRQRLTYFVDFLDQKNIHDTEQLSSDLLRAFIVDLRQRDAHEHTNHHVRGQRLSNRTVFHYSRIIKSFGEWLCEQEITGRNPFNKVKMPKVEKKLMPALPVPDMIKLYDVIHSTGEDRVSRDLALYSFMLESGTRASEVIKLTLDDLDLQNCVAKVHGKGAKERMVCFTEKTVQLLQEYFKERPQVSSREVFLNLQTGRPLTTNGLGEIISEYGRRAGLHCYPHLLRHTFATRYLVNGDEKNLLSLQKLLGHETLDMVRRYVELLPVVLSPSPRLRLSRPSL